MVNLYFFKIHLIFRGGKPPVSGTFRAKYCLGKIQFSFFFFDLNSLLCLILKPHFLFRRPLCFVLFLRLFFDS